jgi:mono/diheme cytochrome c family protein
MLNPFVLFSAVILFAFTPLPTPHPMMRGAVPPTASATTNAAEKADAAALAKAKGVYTVDCAMCHGDNGNGKTDLAKDMQLTLGDWTDPKTLAATTDKEMFDAIRNGKGKMPAEGEARATDDEVKNLIAYIRSMAKGQPAAPASPTN